MKRILFVFVISLIIAIGLWSIAPTSKALAAVCTWTGATDNAWTTPGNWSGCGVSYPQAADDAVIPSVATLPVITTAVNITNLTIDSGASLNVNSPGSLAISGNLTCNGAYTAQTGTTTTFSGTANQSVSGTGSTTFGLINVNNTGTAPTNIVEILPTSFNADPGFLTLTQGILKISGSFTLSNSIFPVANYVIVSGTGLWLNNANFTVPAAPGGSLIPVIRGLLRISAGTYNVGDLNTEGLFYDAGSTITIEGGSLVISGRFNGFDVSSTTTFNMSGGTMIVDALVGVNEGLPTFYLQGASNVTISGGTIVMQNENVGTGGDFQIDPAAIGNITGGSLQFGNASTVDSAPSFTCRYVEIPGLSIVSNGSNSPSVTLSTNGTDITIDGNVSIGAGTSLNANNYNIIVATGTTSPGNWINDGSYTAGLGWVAFVGTSAQSIGGSTATTFYDLYILNSTNATTLASSPSVNGQYLFIAPGATLALGNNNLNAAATNVTNNGTITSGTGVLILNGAGSQNLGGSGPYTNLTINNTNTAGVVLQNSLTVNGSLIIGAPSFLNFQGYSVSGIGAWTNNGLLRQTLPVTGSTPVTFLGGGGYGGIILNANGVDLGSTVVSIWGNRDCTNNPGETVKRCFFITPTNATSLDASITFFFATSEMVGGSSCATLNAWNNYGGADWGVALTLDGTYGTGGRLCGASPQSVRVIHVSSFSPFALKSAAPTVIELRNLTAQSNTRISVVLLAVTLGILILAGGMLYLRKRSAA